MGTAKTGKRAARRPEENPAGSFWHGHLERLQERAAQLYLSYTGLLAEIAEAAGHLAGSRACRGAGEPAVPVAQVELGEVGGMRAVRMVFPVVPAPFNRWFRRSQLARWSLEVDAETRALWETLVAAAMPGFDGVGPFEKATLFIRHVRPEPLDADAIDYTVKYLVDALVLAGLLAGDSGEQLEYHVKVVTDPRSQGFVEVTAVEGSAFSPPGFVPLRAPGA